MHLDMYTQLLPPSEVPTGDILIHAGDLTRSGTAQELGRTLDWLRSLPHPHKVFIGGSHDTGLAHDDVRASLGVSPGGGGFTYLDNETVDIAVRERTVRPHGSAWTPQHGKLAQELWTGLEPGLDVLVTHGPRG